MSVGEGSAIALPYTSHTLVKKGRNMSSMTESNLAYTGDEHPLHGTWLSVDVVALTRDLPEAKVVLIRRSGSPHKGKMTLPGALLEAWNQETVEHAARRIMRDKAGLKIIGDPVVVDVVSDPQRDERGHTVSIVVVVRVPKDSPGAVPIRDVPKDMPFGHSSILDATVSTLSSRILTDPQTTYSVLGDSVVITDALAVMRALTPDTPESAIRARVARSPLYEVSERTPSGVGRPPRVFTRAS